VLALLDSGYTATIFDNLDNSFEAVFDRMKELAGDKADKMKFVKVSGKMFFFFSLPPRHSEISLDAFCLTHAHTPLSHTHQGDLRYPADVDAALGAEKFDAVIHFAGRKAVGESVAEPMLYYTHNVVGTVNLIEAMRKHGVKKVSERKGGKVEDWVFCFVFFYQLKLTAPLFFHRWSSPRPAPSTATSSRTPCPLSKRTRCPRRPHTAAPSS
jgi:GDP-mannose 4,6 dehydratase